MALSKETEDQLKLKEVISFVSRDKSVEKSLIIEDLEQAILHAARREMFLEADLEASYNEEIDEIELFQYRTVVVDESTDMDEKEVVRMAGQFYKLYLHPKFLAHQLRHLNSLEDLDYLTRGAKAIWGHIKDFADIRESPGLAK